MKSYKEYRIVKLTDIATLKRGSEPGSYSYCLPPEGTKFIRVGDISGKTDKPINTKSKEIVLCKKSDILMSFDGNPGIVVTGFEGAISSGIRIISIKDSGVLKDYLFFYLKSDAVQRVIKKYSIGTTIIHASKAISHINVFIPSVFRQKKIINFLKLVEKLKQKREQVNHITNKLIQSVFLKMFGDPVLNNRKFPMESLDNIVANERYALKRGPFGGSLKKNIFVKEGYKVYEQQNAIKNDFELGHYYITSKKFEEMKAFSVNPGDIIISCSGTIGKVAIVPSNAKKGIINQALLKITFDRNKISPIFAKFLIETPQIQELLFGSARGSGIRNIASMAILKSVQIPIPPLSLQNKFAEIAKKIEILKEKQKLSEVKINNLFQSLTNIAFEVEL